MGVKELWGILAPAKREVPLESLKGQTIAVDLSVWICENNNVKAFQGRVLKPHLRNLFFRVSNLQKLGVKLVFVIDGDAPELKWETIQTRIQARFPGRGRGNRGGGIPRQKSSSRSHFKSLIKECQEMLDMLGVPYVQAQGEAEAMCALLNEQGIVDACITEDGDVFLYGARWVYKNFNLSSKDPVIASYKMADIEALGFDREALVGLGLLLGCDFIPKGVPGVGKVHAVGLVHHLRGSDILARFRDWARGRVSFEKSLPGRPSHCSRCHHVGTAQAHKSGGCSQCGGARTCGTTKDPTPCTCVWHLAKEEFDKSSLERDIMMKALQVPGFPPQQVIDEFLVTKDRCPKGALQSTRPHMVPIMKFAFKKLEWPEVYTRSKVTDLVTLFDLEAAGGHKTKTRDPLLIDHILKKRTRAGVSCLEVAWVLPDSWRLEEDDSDIICTIERLDLLKSAHPTVVTDFETTELNKKSRKKGQRGKKSAKLPEECTTSTDGDLADQRLPAPTDIESIAGQLSRLELQNDRSAEKSLAPRAEEDVIEILDDSPGSCNPGRTAPANLDGGDYAPASTDDGQDVEVHSYLPSLRERLRTKGRAKESEKCRKSRCRGSETAVGMTSDKIIITDVSSASVTADHSNSGIRIRTDRERVVGRSSLRDRRQLNPRNVVNIDDNEMVGNSVCDIPTQRCCSMDEVYPTSATRNQDAATNDIPEWSCISDDDISVISGHISHAKVKYEGVRPSLRSRSPDLSHETAGDIVGPSRDTSDGPGSATFHTTFPAPRGVNTPDICEVTEGDLSEHLSQVTSRAFSHAPSREPDGFGESRNRSDCSRSVMCHTTFPAPHEFDTPDVTLSDGTLEDEQSKQMRMNNVNILPTTKEGLSFPTPEEDATHAPEDPSKILQETAVSDKLLTASSLRQRLLLRQTEVLASGGGGGGIPSTRGGDTPEPTLLDLDTPFQTPSQTPLQSPTQTEGTSVGERAVEDSVYCQTPFSADAPTANNQPVCESPASFLTADMATPSSISTSSGLCGEPDNSSPGSFATPGSTVGFERSRDHSMFGELNFSLQTSLWSPWDANSIADSQKFPGRQHPSVNDLSSKRVVSVQEDNVSGRSSMASRLIMSKESVSVSGDRAVITTPNAMYTGVRDRDRVSADERFTTPAGGGYLTTSSEGHTDVFESPRGSPMASLENLNKVLDMDAAQSDCDKQISMQRLNVEKDGSSGERALPRKWEQAKKGDLSRNVLKEDGNVTMKDREDVVWEKKGLLDLSSQIGRLGLQEHSTAGAHSTGDARLVKDTGGMNIHHRGAGVFSLADKENSPVSLMDRLRRKNTRHRDILKSMELDKWDK